MKKQKLINAILFSALLIGSIPGFSQGFSVGVRLGGDLGYYSNFSDLKSEYEVDENSLSRSPHTGFQGGFVVGYSFNNHFGIQGELIFERKGARYSYEDNDFATVETKYGITYLTIPILIKAGTEFGKFKVHGIIGPYFGMGLGGKATTMGIEVPVQFKKEPQLEDGVFMKRFDFGFTIGIIPAYKLGPGDVSLDLRYNLGFLDTRNPYNEGDGYYSQCNRSIGISVGYTMTLEEIKNIGK